MDMVLYLEDPRNSTRKLLEVINKFCKVEGYKISTHKSNEFLYISDESNEQEIRKTTPFIIAWKAKQNKTKTKTNLWNQSNKRGERALQ